MLRRMLMVLVLGGAAWLNRGSIADSGLGRQVAQALGTVQDGLDRFSAAHASGAIGVQTTVADRVLPAMRARFEEIRARLAQGGGTGGGVGGGQGAAPADMDGFLRSRLGREMVAAQSGGAATGGDPLRR